MRFRKFLSLLFFVVFTGLSIDGAKAAWPRQILDANPFVAEDAHAFFDTVQGTCRLERFKVGLLETIVEGKEYHWFRRHPFKERTSFATNVFLQRDENKKILAADLVTLLPGTFASSFDQSTLNAAVLFHRAGYHVLIIPNPWSVEYLRKANGFPGNIPREAKEAMLLIEEFQRYLKKKNALKRSHLVGLSYGAFLGAVVGAFDVEEERDLIDGRLLLVGPPVDMGRSLERLDRYMEKASHRDRPGPLELRHLYNEICRTSSKAGNSKKLRELREMAEWIVAARTFKSFLASRVSDLDLHKEIGKRPSPSDYDEGWMQALDEWKSQIDFDYYLTEYAPHLRKYLDSDESLLLHWIDRVQAVDAGKLLVLTSQNDFLNDPEILDGFGDEALILPSGGHLGYATHSWTKKIILQVLQATEASDKR